MAAPWVSSRLQRHVVREPEEESFEGFQAAGRNLEAPATTALRRFGWDITAAARNGDIDPVIGREDEIAQMVESLLRRTKNNAVLIGEPGVGKTAIAMGLASLINSGDVPPLLSGRRVVALDVAALVAGTRFRGEFEERVKAVIKEVEGSHRQIILFIDELHTIVGAGAAEGALDASNILKPALARGLQLIGATTVQEYRAHIEPDGALERRFQQIYVDEPSVAETVTILRGLSERYEQHHGVRILDAALEAAAALSARSFIDRHLPDKAIDLVDRACARVVVISHAMRSSSDSDATETGVAEPVLVRVDDVEAVVESLSGAPTRGLASGQSVPTADIVAQLERRIHGQPEAIRSMANVLSRRVEATHGRRPRGSMILGGPPGVGKTSAAYAIALAMFGDADRVLRFDMSQYMDRHGANRLFGTAPGLVGHDRPGELVEAVRRMPHSIVLLDEIDHTPPEVLRMLTPILERGALQDARGSVASFSNVVVVMTRMSSARLGGSRSDEDGITEAPWAVPQAILDRVDAVVSFNGLDSEAHRKLLHTLTSSFVEELNLGTSTIDLSPEVMDLVLAKAGAAERGAWDLRRAFHQVLDEVITDWAQSVPEPAAAIRLVVEGHGDRIGVAIPEDGPPP